MRRPLIEIAARSVRRDGDAVRPQDAMPAHTLDEALTTRIVVEERGRVRFPLILFAQWFAAQGIIDGTIALDDVLDDAARLENWRYPLAIAYFARRSTMRGVSVSKSGRRRGEQRFVDGAQLPPCESGGF